MYSQSLKFTAVLAVFVVFVFTGCQESLVSPAPDAPAGPDDPITESEFKQRMAEDGVVILAEDQFAQFGIQERAPEMVQQMASGDALSKTQVCTNRTSGLYDYSVCSEATEETAFNALYFRVQIDAVITADEICLVIPHPIEPIDGPIAIDDPTNGNTQYKQMGAAKNTETCFTPTTSLSSTTARQDGVVLQNNVTDSGTGLASTTFVAFYPRADNFTFNHTSTFDQPSDQISVSVTP
jgi:hypothetical protein